MISVDHVYSEKATKVLQDADSKSNTHRVVEFDRNKTRFRVEDMVNPRQIRPAGKFVVRLDERWCDCGKFQKIHLPLKKRRGVNMGLGMVEGRVVGMGKNSNRTMGMVMEGGVSMMRNLAMGAKEVLRMVMGIHLRRRATESLAMRSVMMMMMRAMDTRNITYHANKNTSINGGNDEGRSTTRPPEVEPATETTPLVVHLAVATTTKVQWCGREARSSGNDEEHSKPRRLEVEPATEMTTIVMHLAVGTKTTVAVL
ncbi:hypothetical protein VIGAN_09113100 [Vigna angularis var. angularis]|uniref:Uncharacterized protein n=1 Tax=Vigna angularis var. angularis TaxID=157739 RepID=A0A0S3SXV7_PHAAN|nr:hypothetical protein VIGAN_09113100 [Vigna angularis var. angularis]